MVEENNKLENEDKDKVGGSEDAGKGDKSQTVIDTERIRTETEGLNKAIAEKESAEARLKLGGGTEAGQKPITAEEETPKEYHKRINKELAEGKTEFGN